MRRWHPFPGERRYLAVSPATLLVMTSTASTQPTKPNGLQISLLRLFDRSMSDEGVLELRRVLVAHMSQKLLEEVERVNEERGYTAANAEAMLNAPS